MQDGGWIKTPREIDAWARTAQPGDVLIYARGIALPAGSATGAAARKLFNAHKVGLHLRRCDGALEYVMRRKAPPRAFPGKAMLTPARAMDDRADAARVYRVLVLCSDHGRPCPTNEELARLAGVMGKDRASYAMKRLVQAGMIESEIVDNRSGARVVTICESGRKTAAPKVAA